MTAISLPRRRTPVWPLFLIMLMFVGLAYANIPRTPHADLTHADEKWNPATIQTYFELGKCKPQIDVCEQQDFEVHWCTIDGKNSVGLVIGHTVKKVITGFMARTNYWSTRCQ